MGDDRVLRITWVSAWVVAGVLVTAAAVLTLFPAHTESLWAWPMGPPMTALTVGGGYLAGAVFFVRAVRSGRWHTLSVGLLCAAVLTVLLLAATVLHWGLFSHGKVAFWVWTAVYGVTPLYLPWLWRRNRRHDPGVGAPSGRLVPTRVRWVVGAVGAVQLAVALAFFARPSLAVEVWPWTLTPLTARTVSAFVAFVAVTWLAFLVEARWSAHRLHVQSTTLGLVFVAAGAVRAAEDFTGGPVATAVFVGLLGGAIVGLVWLQAAMRPRPLPEPPGAPESPAPVVSGG